MSNINEKLLKSMRTIAKQEVDSAPYDKTRKGQILAINTNNTYKIRMDGVEYPNVPIYGDGSGIKVNDIVKVILPGNQTSQMYIEALLNMRIIIDTIYYIGKIIEADTLDFNPNQIFPWQEWERTLDESVYKWKRIT